MTPTRTAFGTWSGGRFMHFGEPLADDRFIELIQLAWERGVRTFLSADVYGLGQASALLGRALTGIDRNSLCLAGMIGHDIYAGQRAGSKGYPRFTDPALRRPSDYAAYLRMAAEKELERLGTDRFDLLLLHNPDQTGYASEAVWKGMQQLKEAGLTGSVGIAPGPANGFTLDLLLNFERFAGLVEWAMIILNPLEPWPGMLCLEAAQHCGVKLVTRVVDHGGLFHDDVKPGHRFGPHDHRTFRPAGWVASGCAKLDQMRPIAEAHGLTMLQLACAWNLAQPQVACVVPTLIQEAGPDAKPIEVKLEELAGLPDATLDADEQRRIHAIGNNTGCMALKGGSAAHTGPPSADAWPLNPDLEQVAARWRIDPLADLLPTP